jgi:hypothetical protein
MFVEHFSGISSDNDFLCNECQENLYCEADDDNCSIFITKSKFPSFNLDESIFYTNEITNYKKVNEQISTDYNKSENTTFSLYEKESEQISIISNQTGPENNKESNDIKDLAHLLPNNNNTKQNVRYKIIPEEKKKFMGRKRRNDESNRKKSWDNQMDVWKNIRVKINKSLHSIINEFSKKYGFNKFFSFNGNISTKKDINEILLNENIKNYIIRQGISNNFNKGKTEDEKEKNNKNNLNLICKILQFENNLDYKPFTEFVNMNFKKFYFDIFLNNKNNDINILYQNKYNFHQFIKELDGEKKKVYEKIAKNIYDIYENKKSRTPKIKECK